MFVVFASSAAYAEMLHKKIECRFPSEFRRFFRESNEPKIWKLQCVPYRSLLLLSICGLDGDQCLWGARGHLLGRCTLLISKKSLKFFVEMLTANQQMCSFQFLSLRTCVVHLDCTVPRWMQRPNDADVAFGLAWVRCKVVILSLSKFSCISMKSQRLY